jgi:hypothetical protein
MNLTLEVKVSDIVKAISGYNTDPVFNEAVANAVEREKTSTADFITLFKEEFERLNPNGQLATIFATLDMKDRFNRNMSNSEVISVLRDETEAAIQNEFNVLLQVLTFSALRSQTSSASRKLVACLWNFRVLPIHIVCVSSFKVLQASNFGKLIITKRFSRTSFKPTVLHA